MNFQDIYSTITNTLINEFNIKKEDISLDAIFMRDIKLNSLKLMFFISNIESKYNIEFDEDDLLKISNVNSFCNLILDYLKSKQNFE